MAVAMSEVLVDCVQVERERDHDAELQDALAFWDANATAGLATYGVVGTWDVTNVTEVLAGGYDVIRNVGYDKTSWCVPHLRTHLRLLRLLSSSSADPRIISPLIVPPLSCPPLASHIIQGGHPQAS